MTDFKHDPNSLADQLDQVLPPGETRQIGSSDDPLINAAVRLASAPRPALTPAAMARIRAKMDAAPPAPALRFSPARLALVASLAVLVIAGAVFGAQRIAFVLNSPTPTVVVFPSNTPSVTATPAATQTPTVMPTQTVPPSATAMPTIPATAAAPVSATPETVVPPSVETSLPTLEPTQPVTAPASAVTAVPPTAAPTDLPVTLVVEGPVQAINGNIIVIYDIEIVLSPDDPILTVVQVGDVVRVDGSLSIIASEVTVTAVEATVVNVEVNVSPQGETWRDPGDCSNPPPPWAPANGWRRRCEGAPNPGNSGNSGNNGNNGNGRGNSGNNPGRGMGNDDDDD